jgi:hypothetical protein
MRRPELGSRLAVGHPQGLALTSARVAPHSRRREQGVKGIRLRATAPPRFRKLFAAELTQASGLRVIIAGLEQLRGHPSSA